MTKALHERVEQPTITVTGYVCLVDEDGPPDWDSARTTLQEVEADCAEYGWIDHDIYKFTATLELAKEVLTPETIAKREQERQAMADELARQAPAQANLF